METVILPYENMRELVEIPGYVKKKIKFVPVKNMDEVVKAIFGEK